MLDKISDAKEYHIYIDRYNCLAFLISLIIKLMIIKMIMVYVNKWFMKYNQLSKWIKFKNIYIAKEYVSLEF